MCLRDKYGLVSAVSEATWPDRPKGFFSKSGRWLIVVWMVLSCLQRTREDPHFDPGGRWIPSRSPIFWAAHRPSACSAWQAVPMLWRAGGIPATVGVIPEGARMDEGGFEKDLRVSHLRGGLRLV